MSARDETTFLVTEIRRSLAMLDRIERFYDGHAAPGESDAERTTERAIVVGETTHHALWELLRFRHFKRYYFEFDYDWDRLDFLRKKLSDARGPVRGELGAFIAALQRIESEPHA